jgi:hypothetical protein
MCTIDYEAARRRLRVSGHCGDDAAAAITEAIGAFGRGSPALIVDLTALSGLTDEVANAIVTAGEQVAPCQLTVLRKHGTEVDRRLSEALRS